MRLFTYTLLALGALCVYGCRASYTVPDRLKTNYAPLDKKLAGLVNPDSLAISAREAAALPDALYLDAREVDEYLTSHLPGAVFLGFNRPDYDLLASTERDRPLVVYCTVGYRSERIAGQLRRRGFVNVYNLYGSLYAWKLAGFPLVNAQGATENLHTYNRKWGTYIPDSLGTKIN